MSKCIECGTEIESSAKICPNCGCPVQNAASVEVEKKQPEPISEQANKRSAKKFGVNIAALISLVLGIAIIGMGFGITNKKFDIEEYDASRYSVDSARFGGDFYTEIYGAVDTAVDGISAINGGVAVLSTSMVQLAEVVTYSAGMIIVAVGMGVTAVSVLHIKKKD